MIRFIDEHRDRFGVELICRVLRPAVQGFLTSRGYRAAVGRAPSARQLRDDLLVPEVARLHAENYGVYGRRKMHALMRRQGWDIGRDQTERLMRLAGVRGVQEVEAGVHDDAPTRPRQLPSDLVNRRFTAAGAAAALGLRRDLRRDLVRVRLRRVRHRRLLTAHRRLERCLDSAGRRSCRCRRSIWRRGTPAGISPG